jgi:type I restriction enzyme, S subunit
VTDLKPGWKRVRFGQMVTSVGATRKARGWSAAEDEVDRYIGLEHLDSNSLKIRRWGSPESVGENSDVRLFEPGDVILARRRIYQRKVGVAEFRGIASGHALVFRAIRDVVLPDFLPFFMQSDAFMERADRFSAGSLSGTVNLSALVKEEFALPPLEEQRRLVSALLSVLENHDALHEAANAFDAVEAALLLSEFGEYDPAKLSKGVPLATIATIQSGVAKGRAPEAGTTTEAPYLRVANVKDGELDLNDIQLITVETSRLHQYRLRPGDVLMTEGGDLDKLGRGTVWQGEVDGCIHQNHVFAVRPDVRRLDPWYLAALARSSFGRGYFQKCAKRTSNLASVNKRELGEFPIREQSLGRQKAFVEAWRSLRHQRSQLDIRARMLRQLTRVLIASEQPS